jgi:hypothetical protein
MIYFFDAEHHCIFKSTLVTRPDEVRLADHHKELLGNVADSFFSVNDYKLTDIWYSRGRICLREPNPTTIVDTVLRNLPKLSVVKIGNAQYEFDDPDNDGMMLLNFAFPGTYIVTVESWPYLNKSFKVIVP